jgi:hypothetical protein
MSTAKRRPGGGRGADPKGRSKRDAKHVRLYWWIMDSSAWRHLSCYSRALLVETMYRFDGSNNGRVIMSVREAAALLNADPKTAHKALRQLQDVGFIKPAERGSFNVKQPLATSWILTMFPLGEALPTKNFMRWTPPRKQNTVGSPPTGCGISSHSGTSRNTEKHPHRGISSHSKHENQPLTVGGDPTLIVNQGEP